MYCLAYIYSFLTGCFGTTYVDQAYWQSGVAAKPRQGVLGFLAGGLVWFSIPFALATTMGLAYTALGTQQGQPLLNETDVNAGKEIPLWCFCSANQIFFTLTIIITLVK
jgi:hypothetical protein